MNQENKKQIILAAVLGVVLVGVLFFQFVIKGGAKGSPPKTSTKVASRSATPRSTTPTAGGGPTKIKTVDVDIDALLREIEVVTFDYERERIDRNPMTPLIGYINTGDFPQQPVAQASMVQVMQKAVSGIVFDEFNPVAVIDDEVVGLGHTYPDGVEVYSIERNRVVFRVGDSMIPVELKEL